MSSLSANDRVSLCLFSFSDGRRCRTPRTGNHPHFCFYHAQKESQSQAAETLAKDLAAFFSGDYLSACDLSAALARLIPAVVRGDIKPRLARTVAYMLQTQLQAIHLSQHEYINAFGPEGWRKAIRTSVNANYDHRFPTTLEPQQPTTSAPQQPAQASPSTPSKSTQARKPRQQPAASTPPESTPPSNLPPAAASKSPANPSSISSVAPDFSPAPLPHPHLKQNQHSQQPPQI